MAVETIIYMKETFRSSFLAVYRKCPKRNKHFNGLIIAIIILSLVLLSCILLEDLIPRKTNQASLLKIKKVLKNDLYSKQKCKYGSQGPRILCCVITHFGNLETKVIAIKNTWGKYRF